MMMHRYDGAEPQAELHTVVRQLACQFASSILSVSQSPLCGLWCLCEGEPVCVCVCVCVPWCVCGGGGGEGGCLCVCVCVCVVSLCTVS